MVHNHILLQVITDLMQTGLLMQSGCHVMNWHEAGDVKLLKQTGWLVQSGCHVMNWHEAGDVTLLMQAGCQFQTGCHRKKPHQDVHEQVPQVTEAVGETSVQTFCVSSVSVYHCDVVVHCLQTQPSCMNCQQVPVS